MQGLSILTDPQGNPKTVMIDLQQHDSKLNTLVAGLLDLLQQQDEDTQRREFFNASGITANAAYSDDEVEYTINDCAWVNPDFNPHATR
jgi:hypothetical protein